VHDSEIVNFGDRGDRGDQQVRQRDPMMATPCQFVLDFECPITETATDQAL
jgi:hypothetical protein